MRRYILITFFLLGLGVLAAMAADASGTWLAQIPGREGNMVETTFQFKVSGAQLTGTMQNQWGEREISDGKVAGDDITFTVKIEFGGNEMIFLYSGKVAGDEIKFIRERKGGDAGPIKVEFVAKRKN